MQKPWWLAALAALGLAVAVRRRKKKAAMQPENVVELESGTSTKPMAYGSKAKVQHFLDEYAAYLAEAGVNLSWFSVEELTKLRRTGKYAIPPRHLWDEMARTIVFGAQPIRAEFGSPLNIYNAYRPRWYNELVKGAKNSLHIRNGALDMIPYKFADRRRLAEIAARYFIAHGDEYRMGMGIYNYPKMTGLHVDALVRSRPTPYAATKRWIRAVQGAVA